MASGCREVALLLLVWVCVRSFLARWAAFRCDRSEGFAAAEDDDDASPSGDIIDTNEEMPPQVSARRLCPRDEFAVGVGCTNEEFSTMQQMAMKIATLILRRRSPLIFLGAVIPWSTGLQPL